MSSPDRPISNLEDVFSSNFPNYVPLASPDYVPTSPGKTYSSASNSFGIVPLTESSGSERGEQSFIHDRYVVSSGSGYAVLISLSEYAVLDRKLDTPYPMEVDTPYSTVDQNSTDTAYLLDGYD
ncbi:hypothetical protein Tco_0948741, partial [Tanacetum coccineum]